MDIPIITKQHVVKSFGKIQIRKAGGPDRLLGIVLKECKDQLSEVFQNLYQLSLDSHTIPTLWKTSNIIPIPKKPNPVALNDYRPVALTSIAMKSYERLIKGFFLSETEHLLDANQFAYKPQKGVEDATMTVTWALYSS